MMFELKKENVLLLIIVFLFIFLGTKDVQAHRDDYIDETLVYLTVEKSEAEVEYWLDYGTQSNGRDSFLRHNTALELGITDHLMIDTKVTVRKEKDRNTKFDAGRLETRYRLFEEGDLPVDIALSGEVNWQRKEDDSIDGAIESRIIFSKDLAEQFNMTLNLTEEVLMKSGKSAFNVALGVRDNWNDFIRFGSEFQYDTLDKSGSIIPQVWFAFPRELAVKIGYSVGFAQNRENFGRVAFEMEF